MLARAMTLADLVNSKYVTQADKLYSLNEAWRDLYSALTESDDDYFLEVVVLPMAGATALDRYTWTMPLPENCYKVRYIDYQATTDWIRMDRFALEERNDGPGDPSYRIRNQELWLAFGPATPVPSQIRVGYYPAPARLSAPEVPRSFGLSSTEAVRASAAWPFLDPEKNILVYTDGTSIFAEPFGGSPLTFAAVAGASHIMYYRGFLYLVRAATGFIYRVATDLLAAAVPVALVAPANVSRAYIVNQRLFYYDTGAADIIEAALDGSGGAATALGNVSWLCGFDSGLAYLSAAGAITVPSGVVAGIVADYLTSNGSDVLYYRVGTELHRLTLDGIVIETDDIIAEDVGALGIGQGAWVGVAGFNEPTLYALSLADDSDLAYPSNMIPEILAYQCAFDFKRKGKAPQDELAGLLGRRNELKGTLLETLKRDEYKVEHINNVFYRRVY
jgi:hypothetical protein